MALGVAPASVVDSVRTLMGNAALLLLVGGLSILFLIVLLVVLQALVPARRIKGDMEEPEAIRPQLRPLSVPEDVNPEVYAEGVGTRRVPTKPTVDRAMDRIVQLKLGEPRMLRHRPRYTHVRLYSCRTCAPSPDGQPKPAATGCTFEQAGVEEAFQTVYGPAALVRESGCRLSGHAACEFEVRH